MKIQKRQYQEDSVNELSEGFKYYQRQVLCLPTGSGKTVIFSNIVKRAYEKETQTLVLTDRTELFKQTIKSLSRVGLQVEEIKPGRKFLFPKSTIILAMVETIARRKEALKAINPKLIIIDEAHKGNFTKIIDTFPSAKVIGATATPVGKHFFKYYQNIVQPIDTPELIKQGYLCPVEAYQMVDDFTDLDISRGEFTDASLFSHFNKPTLYKGVVKEWKNKALDKKTIVFCCNIKHAEETCNEFIREGIKSAYVTSKTPKTDRERILKEFSAGFYTVLVNCGILTTGYDEPSIECVIMNRATKSLTLWLQCVGRGSRLFPGKEKFILLDFGGNHDRLGNWDDDRFWVLEAPKKRKLGESPVKTCPECTAMLHASVTKCSYCGYIFPVNKSKPKEGVLKMVSDVPKIKVSKASMERLISAQKSGELKSAYVWRVMSSRGANELRKYANAMNYSGAWYRRQLREGGKVFTDKEIKV